MLLTNIFAKKAKYLFFRIFSRTLLDLKPSQQIDSQLEALLKYRVECVLLHVGLLVGAVEDGRGQQLHDDERVAQAWA